MWGDYRLGKATMDTDRTIAAREPQPRRKESALSSSLRDRLGALSGVGAVGLIAAHMILADPYDPATNPNPTEPSAALARALVENREEARLGAHLGLAGAFLLLWFVGYLRQHLRHAEGEDGWLASVAYGGGMVATVLVLVSVGFDLAASELASYGDDPQVAKTYFIYGWGAAALLAPPFGAMVTATTVAGLRHAALPRWFAWFSLLVAALIAALSASAVGLGALVGLLWLGLLSLVLCLWPWRAARPPDHRATPRDTYPPHESETGSTHA